MSTVDSLASALPAFITEQNSLIPQLLAAYYTWLDSKSPQDITAIRDVRKTQYLDDIVREFVVGISPTTNTDIPLLVDNVIDLYRMKGTPVGIDAFYRLVYGVEPEITFPRDRTFALSASTWVQQYQMETDITDPAVANAAINQIVASATGSARVISAHFASTNVSQRCILTIHDVRGNFAVGQRLVVGTHAFKLLGSLGAFILPSIDPSVDSQTLTASSATGASAKVSARANVVAVNDVQATVINKGSGYTANAKVYVSNVVVDVENLSITSFDPTSIAGVLQTVYHAEYTYEPAAPVSVGDTLTLRSGVTTKATANVVAILPSTSLGQKLLLTTSADGSNVATSNNFVKGANTYSNVAFADNTAIGRWCGWGDTFTLTLSSQEGAISVGDPVYQYSMTTLKGSGVVTAKPASNKITVQADFGAFSNAWTTKNVANSSVANIAVVSAVAGSVGISNVVNTFGVGNKLEFAGASADVVAVHDTNGVFLNISEFDNQEKWITNNGGFFNEAILQKTLVDGANTGSTIYVAELGRIADVGVQINQLPEKAPIVYIESTFQSLNDTVELTVSNAAGFSVGQKIQQFNAPGQLVTMAGANTALLRVGEIFAVPNKASPGFIGVFSEFTNAASINGQAIVHHYFGDTNWSGEGWTTLQTYTSNVTVTASSIETANVGGGTTAIVQSIDGNVLKCSVNNDTQAQWQAPSIASTYDRFYSSNVTAVSYTTSGSYPGYNAQIRLDLSPSDINTHTLNVDDSGQGFVNGQIVTLTDDNGVDVGTAVAVLHALGTVPGISTNDRSKLAAGQHLQDGRIYQQYSINIASSVDVDKYVVNQQFTDIAGFENLSTPLIKSTQDIQPAVSSAQVGTQNV